MSNMYGYSDYNGPENLHTFGCKMKHDVKQVIVASSQRDEEIIISQQDIGKDKHHHYQTPYQTDDDDDDDMDEVNDTVGTNRKRDLLNNEDDVDINDADFNPLQAGFWMDGDSLAPPCGTAVSTIHKILDIAFTTDDDKNNDITRTIRKSSLYDLGCGDGRICLEAYARYKCPCTIGVEIEADLVERARYLISKLPPIPATELEISLPVESGKDPITTTTAMEIHPPRIIQMDLRLALDKLIERAAAVVEEASVVPKEQNHQQQQNQLSNDNKAVSTTSGFSCHDLPLPTIIILYLLPEALIEIKPKLIKLLQQLPDLKIICQTWGLPKDIRPYKEVEIMEENGVVTPIFVYTHQYSLIPLTPAYESTKSSETIS